MARNLAFLEGREDYEAGNKRKSGCSEEKRAKAQVMQPSQGILRILVFILRANGCFQRG